MILGLAIAFAVLAIIAGVLGAGGVAGMSMNIAKWLIIVFLVLAVVSYVVDDHDHVVVDRFELVFRD